MEQSNDRLSASTPHHNSALPHPAQLQHADLVNILARRWQHAHHNGILFIRLDLQADKPISTEKRRS